MRTILLAFFLLVTGSLLAQDCSSVKNGRFKMVTPGLGTTLIERKNGIQYETVGERNLVGVFTVKWLSACRYTLTPTKETIRQLKMPANTMVTVDIVRVTKNGYYQVVSGNNSKEKLRGEVVRVK